MNQVRWTTFVLVLLLITTLILLSSLAGCDGLGPSPTKPPAAEVPFETVAKVPEVPVSALGAKKRATHEGLDLLIAADQAEAQQIVEILLRTGVGDYFQESVQQIVGVDYEEFLVIVADWGAKPTGGWEVTIEEITQVGRDVQVVARLIEPAAGDAVITHPIHAVKVSKMALTTGGPLNLVLMEGDKVVLSQEYSVP